MLGGHSEGGGGGGGGGVKNGVVGGGGGIHFNTSNEQGKIKLYPISNA